MNVEFVNRYTVTREGHVHYHYLEPGMVPSHAVDAAGNEGPAASRFTAGGVARIAGLILAIGIIVVALMGGMTLFLVVGIVLAAMYAVRILQARSRREQAAFRPKPPLSLQPSIGQGPSDFDERARWTRYVRFGGEDIEVVDPHVMKDYTYRQILRITEDSAYITLWMDDHTQVRVKKNGFTLGTLDAFEQFIMSKTHRMIGPGAGEETGDLA